jgi:fused signal recognition particle receptor
MSSFWSAARSFSLAGVSQALKKSSLVNKITSTVNAIKHSLGFEVAVDANTIDRIEALLLSADVGPKTTSLILDPIRQDIGKLNVDLVMPRIRRSIEEILIEAPKPSLLQNSKNLPTVVLLTGINGAGKTTTAGKIAGLVASQGKKVVMVPADRFRAAASEQLRVWSERAGVQWFKISEKASDPANVTLRGLQFAKSQNAHVAIVDTAGRLHSRVGLMEELKECC